MSLATGSRIGPYEIVGSLGAGGMGEVYRARDSKLNRDVAIKVLPESFAHDPDRLARFEREAQVLAALNHPNIAHIHGLESSSGAGALIMELVEGDDLSELIARGPIPFGEALPIAKQIADALEAAHELGIIHRDLKPANIKVRADGTVKVLGFGLAKALDPATASSAEAMNSPTLTVRGTQMGLIIGTAAYMSPEQARGKGRSARGYLGLRRRLLRDADGPARVQGRRHLDHAGKRAQGRARLAGGARRCARSRPPVAAPLSRERSEACQPPGCWFMSARPTTTTSLVASRSPIATARSRPLICRRSRMCTRDCRRTVTQLAVGIDESGGADIWVYDLKARGSLRRLTFAGRNQFPIWTPDGRFLTFQSDREGDRAIFRQPADGSGPAERLTTPESGVSHEPESWHPDGKTLSINLIKNGDQSVWTISTEPGATPQAVADTTAVEKHSSFSPDGRWLAYMTNNVTGQQVFVQPFPTTGAKYQISTNGGRAPAWSRDGKQLFFHSPTPNRMFAVDIHADKGLTFGNPVALPIEDTIHPVLQRNYDVTVDGQRLVVVVPAQAAQGNESRVGSIQVNVVLNWFEHLAQRVPTRQ